MGITAQEYILEREKDLIDSLNKATELYDAGHPIISDKDWDDMYFGLMYLEERTGIVFPNSPTIKIHFDEKVSELSKTTHGHEMLSLAKTKSLDEVNEFLHNQENLIMLKMDGLTCSLTYRNGHLVSAETRGNGVDGEVITHNAMRISSIPKHINYTDTLVVDGEIICTYDNFKQFETEYKNPRNFAAGSIRLLDSAECEKRNLTFVAWDVIEGLSEFENLNEKLEELESLRFTIVPYLWNKGAIPVEDDVVETLKQKANCLSYPIDGLVFKFNNVKYGKKLGKTAHHFNNAIAYKFYDEAYPTTLKDIEWTMGRTGVLTPVAIFEPLNIDGSVVERASLHNISIMDELSDGFQEKGDTIYVFKANQIIPQINGWEHKKDSDKDSLLFMPETCPICGGETKIKMDNDSEILICDNPNCEGKFINRLDHFCSKKGLDIKGLSKATLEKLVKQGWIENLNDLFTLRQIQHSWKQMPGFGEKSVEKILQSIEDSRETNLESALSAIGIPLIGRTVSKDLAKRFKTYENFRKHINEGYDFSQIDGYGPEMTKALLTFNYEELDFLVENFLIIKEEETKENTNDNALEGLIFVVTGKLKNFKNRDELKAAIEACGGKVSGSITSKTNYLINNDINSNSAKNKSAKNLGIEIITEEDFLKKFDL